MKRDNEATRGAKFTPEFIRNLGARANVLPDVLAMQDVSSILFEGLSRLFQTKPLSVTPASLGWPSEFADSLMTQGRRVTGVQMEGTFPQYSDAEYGIAFVQLSRGLGKRLGDTPAGIGEEAAFTGLLMEAYAIVAEEPEVSARLDGLGLSSEWQGTLEAVEHRILDSESF